MNDNQKRANAIAHLHGVSLTAVMIVKKRGENAELAAMAGLLHDLYAYKSGLYDDHAHKGAEYARQVLEELGITSEKRPGSSVPQSGIMTAKIRLMLQWMRC